LLAAVDRLIADKEQSMLPLFGNGLVPSPDGMFWSASR
jgi:hypothetical protein